MQEVVTDIDRWLAAGEPVALATVIATWGSAPRGVGAKMALTPSGEISGSVSGGCVEGAVYSAGEETLASNHAQLLSFGVADETAWNVGLACGGQIEVFVEPLNSAVYEVTRRLLRDDRAGAVGTVISGPDEWLGSKVVVDENGVVSHNLDVALEEVAIEAAQQALAAGKATRATLQTAGEPAALFVDVILPAPKLVMVGGVHIAIALTSLATTLGYSTIVVDPRRAFGSEARFPHVNRLIQAWPDDAFAGIDLTQSTAVAMLTHDPKIDDPALKIVLPSPVFYVGALGSSRTHAKRLQRLREAGVPQRLLARIHSPIGLDIDAQTPEEIAVAIIAEIVAARHNGSERD